MYSYYLVDIFEANFGDSKWFEVGELERLNPKQLAAKSVKVSDKNLQVAIERIRGLLRKPSLSHELKSKIMSAIKLLEQGRFYSRYLPLWRAFDKREFTANEAARILRNISFFSVRAILKELVDMGELEVVKRPISTNTIGNFYKFLKSPHED